MAKIRRRYILLPGLVVLILCGFSVFRFVFPPLPPPTPTPPPPNWFIDWLNDPMCQPPCWQGIIPGITTITDTVNILRELPWLTITFGPDSPVQEGNRLTIEWRFKPPSQVFGRTYSDEQGIITTYLSFDGILSTTVKEVIDIYGAPGAVITPDCRDNRCRAQLVYLTSGMVIDLGALKPDWRDFVIISGDIPIRGIEFFSPGEDGFLAAYPAYPRNIFQKFLPWNGYAKYPIK